MKERSTIYNQQVEMSVTALKEAFISVLPFLMLSSSVLLLSQLMNVVNASFPGFILPQVQNVASTLSSFFPFVMLVAIAYHFSKRFNVCGTSSLLLSICVLITIETLIYGYQADRLLFKGEGQFLVLIIPISTVFLLKYLTNDKYQLSTINTQLNTSFKYIVPFVVAYFISLTFYILLITLLNQADVFSSLISNNIEFSNDILLLSKTFAEHILWFFGIHGSNFLALFVGGDFLAFSMYPNLSYIAFYDLFVIYGGSGAGLSLIMAILFCAKDGHSRRIAKMALPFAIFNINEILIFGLPIILNRLLLAPFVLVPLVNVTIGMIAMNYLSIEFSSESISWITPVFLNVYILTDGNIFALALQLVLIILGAIIYLPFVKKYSLSQSMSNHREKLIRHLDIGIDLQEKEGILSNQAQRNIIQSNQEVEKIIALFSSSSLKMYYQPKIDLKSTQCHHFEALLRLEKKDGELVQPYFLETLELAGLAPVVDLWVCKKVKEQMIIWAAEGFKPFISINLHPDTLSSDKVVEEIKNMLEGYTIEFEIIERGLAQGESAKRNLNLLKANGFTLSIDDFGTGYSCLDTLSSLPISALKLDKSLIDIIDTPKGYIICKHISAMCRELNFDCVAEGVETQQQLELVYALNIKYIQGFYFSKAITAQETVKFIPNIPEHLASTNIKSLSA